jgi:SAM-dependent methyltransferase
LSISRIELGQLVAALHGLANRIELKSPLIRQGPAEVEHRATSAAEDHLDLPPGAAHYRAYVGPPRQYDLMAATQFGLLHALGLREQHYLLDFGCGSLRAGRLLIPYLLQGRYFGIEPNKWLVDVAIEKEVGADQVRIKRPRFSHNPNFDCSVFGEHFDYIMAQSILSHCGMDLAGRVLREFSRWLKSEGLLLFTFVERGDHPLGRMVSGWQYPRCTRYEAIEIERMLTDVGLRFARIPWYHPRQSWFIASADERKIPSPEQIHFLRGAVFNVPDFAESLK